jgi:hypothetical protein
MSNVFSKSTARGHAVIVTKEDAVSTMQGLTEATKIEFVAKNPVPGAKFSEALPMEHAGYKHTVHRFNYGPSLDWKGFCGGGEVYSYWMEKSEIVGALESFGFTDFRIEQHPNIHGSALMLAARKP